jgi:hypothetical protein
MTSTPRARRWRAVGAATTGVALVAVGTAVANAATAPPPALSMVSTLGEAFVERYVYGDEPGQAFVSGDLGAYLIAGSDPFELRATRASYADKLVTDRVVVKNGRKSKVRLPDGMVTDFTGLQNFTTFTLKDAAGRTVYAGGSTFCPSPYGTERTRPDAPDTSPYPQGCGSNPFLLANVWGIQAGFSAGIDLPDGLDVPDGTYTTTIGIAEKYRSYLQIPADKATATFKLTVNTSRYDEEEDASRLASAGARRALAQAPAAPGADHGHATEGDPKRQVSAYSPDLRPPVRRPSTMARAALPKGPRPDLRSLPAWGISLTEGYGENDEPDGRQYIAFGATVWNAGTSPLVVDGFRRPGTELMDAYQYFYDPAGKQVGSTTAGTMEWDKREGHLHWHFTDFAQYRLLSADKKLAVRSGKEAFCLVNTDQVDTVMPNAKWRPSNTDLSSSCGQHTAVAVREVLDIGNGDTYHQGLPGQSFDVTDLPNGTYYVEVLANPSNVLTELSTANNSSLRQVILSGAGADRKLTVPALHGLDG